ncbi:hypothetical protein HPE63_11065 [Maribacter arenosus]|uniref:Uncharacterized protein n=1 Tax=Maribacter arenosus TaxID=1854708 RepID=A0ABR7VC31_9FLAO|nr:hypothetical protein [Maribacter arenosus]
MYLIDRLLPDMGFKAVEASLVILLTDQWVGAINLSILKASCAVGYNSLPRIKDKSLLLILAKFSVQQYNSPSRNHGI